MLAFLMLCHFFWPKPIRKRITVIIMAKMGRKIPVLGLVVASRITPTQTAKMATVTNMYFIENIIT